MTLLTEPYAPDFPDQASYLLAWYTWRAIRRDGLLTPDELAVQWDVTEDFIRRR